MAMVDVDNEDNDLVASSEEEVESADEGLASAPTMPRSMSSLSSSAGVAAGVRPKAVSKRTPSPSASTPLVGSPKMRSPKKAPKREKEPTKKMTDDAKLMKLVSRQNFDGSFQLDDGLAKLLNTSLDDIKKGKIQKQNYFLVQ